MKYLIIHGIQGQAGIHWQGWLSDNLSKNGHEVIMKSYPDADCPVREKWLETTKNFLSNILLQNLIIVTHSLGAVTAMDFIEGLNGPIRGLVTIAGFYRDYGAELNSYFLRSKDIDINRVRGNIKKSVVIFGDDDPYVPQEELKALAEGLQTESVIIHKGGHLNTDSGYKEFPLVLQKCLELAQEPNFP